MYNIHKMTKGRKKKDAVKMNTISAKDKARLLIRTKAQATMRLAFEPIGRHDLRKIDKENEKNWKNS